MAWYIMFRTLDIDNGKQKYVGRTRGIVLDNRDPLKKGRILVRLSVTGETGWISYLKSPNGFDVPPINSIVYVEAEAGYATHTVASGSVVTGTDDSPNIPEEFRRDVPTNRGLYSPGGHLIEIDDGLHQPVDVARVDTNLTTENRGIRVTSAAGNKIHIVEDTVNNQQYILLQDVSGNFIKLDYQNNQLNINSIGSSNVNTTENKTETVGGNLTINVTGDATITAGGNATVTSPEINLTAATKVTANTPIMEVSGFLVASGIATGGATPVAGDAVVAGNIKATEVEDSVGTLSGFRGNYNSHTHNAPSGGGTTSTPSPTDP